MIIIASSTVKHFRIFFQVLYTLNMLCAAKGMSSRGCGGVAPARVPPPPPPHTRFWNLLSFWQNVSIKLPDPMLLVNLEHFILKNEMQNSINTKYRFHWDLTSNFYQLCHIIKLCNICTNEYDNNEYLAVKYISFFYQRYHVMFVM